MIVTRRISPTKLISFTYPHLIGLLIFIGISVVLADRLEPQLLMALTFASGFLGTALASLIGFRNNEAYDRWREAQKAWSQLKATAA